MSCAVIQSHTLVAAVTTLTISILIGATLSSSAEPDARRTHASSSAYSCRVDRPGILPRASSSRWHPRLDRQTAIHIVRHVQRACRGLRNLVDDHRAMLDEKGITPKIAALIGHMRENVLEPIYRAHPALRGKGLTARGASPRKLAHGTATRMLTVLSALQTEFTQPFAELDDLVSDKDAAKTLSKCVRDVFAEFIFAADPIYKAFPDLWAAEVKASVARMSPRTAESDEGFRKAAPPAGTVKLTAPALAAVRKFLALVHKSADLDAIASIGWVEEAGTKGPNDKEWRTSGPSLQLGSYSRRQVPPDVVETIDGEAIVLSARDPSIFVGKTIDYRDGQFIWLPPSR
jgi:hypothetical protein